jgi:hypothetical protein
LTSHTGAKSEFGCLNKFDCSVNKTFPGFFTAMSRDVGLVVRAGNRRNKRPKHEAEEKERRTGAASVGPEHDPSRSVVIVGMRASGKTTLGTHLAKALGSERKRPMRLPHCALSRWVFVDVDHVIEVRLAERSGRKGASIKDFVRSDGWYLPHTLYLPNACKGLRFARWSWI